MVFSTRNVCRASHERVLRASTNVRRCSPSACARRNRNSGQKTRAHRNDAVVGQFAQRAYSMMRRSPPEGLAPGARSSFYFTRELPDDTFFKSCGFWRGCITQYFGRILGIDSRLRSISDFFSWQCKTETNIHHPDLTGNFVTYVVKAPATLCKVSLSRTQHVQATEQRTISSDFVSK